MNESCETIAQTTQKVTDRFWKNVNKTSTCWIYSSCHDKDGYGRIGMFGKTIRAHRMSYEIHFGKIPNGLGVLHKCDNPACVNPEHLWAGTPLENNGDRAKKGRNCDQWGEKNILRKKPELIPKGSRRAFAKLKESQIPKIRKMLSDNISQTKISKKFNVTQTLISRIKTGKNWNHVI